MKRFSIACVSLFLTFTIFFGSLPTALACGPFTVDPLFSFTRHLDFPLKNYTTDNIGIVPSTYGRISLYVYYRQLNNLPFTVNEKEQVINAIDKRIGTHWSETKDSDDEQDNTKVKESEKSTEPPVDKESGSEKWKAARAKVIAGDTKTETDKQNTESYSYYTNCLEDSFKNAANTLEARVAKYGTDENVKEWVNGQDVVFSNCNSGGKIPNAAADSAPDWLKKDRQYQIAAALFYSDKFSEARTILEQIAADNNSAWQKTAKFVIARAYIRQAGFIDETSPDYESEQKAVVNANTASNANYGSNTSLANSSANVIGNTANTVANTTNSSVNTKSERKITKTEDDKKKDKAELYQKAEVQLQNILSDASMKDFHESAHRLSNYVQYHSKPQMQRAELAKRLAQSGENRNIFNDLTDYIWLLDKTESVARDKGIEIDREQAEKEKKEYNYDYILKIRDIDKDEMKEDLTDWLYSYQATDSFSHSYNKWKQTKKLSWFVAALVKAERNASQLPELLAEAEKIQPNSPAYPTIRYHQIQLLLETEKRAEAKQKLNEILNGSFKTFSRSTQNKFLAQRMILAENLEDFLKYAQRVPATFVWSDDGNEEGDDLKDDKSLAPWANRTMFDDDSVAFFNEKMPLSLLRQAALSPNLPDHLKKFLVIAVWTRAFILRNQPIEKEFAPLMQNYNKEFVPAFSKLASAASPNNREAAALLAVLQNPAIQPYVPVGIGRESGSPAEIDSIRGNWWCVEDENAESYSRYDHYNFEYPGAYPNFLTPAQVTAAAGERKQLIATGASATALAQRALEFANQNPTHPDTPEVLHFAVRSTRYGCTDDNTLKFSKGSFDFLHKRFPGNEWTKKTPYYFGKKGE